METSDQDSRIVVFSDYVCPFCYLGKASLEQYLARADDPPAVDWHVFDLQGYKRGPDGRLSASINDGKDEEYMARAKENVRRLRQEYRVDMSLDFPHGVDSWNAQKLSIHVKETYEEDVFRELHDMFFAALWQNNRNIGDTDILAEIAVEAGIPSSEMKDVVADDDLDRTLEKRFAEAKALGINAVPTFSYDGRFVQGAVPPARLKRFVNGNQQIDLSAGFG